MVGFIKVPLFLKLLFSTLQKFGRLVLWEVMFILELHSAETQELHIFSLIKNYHLLHIPLLPLCLNNAESQTCIS